MGTGNRNSGTAPTPTQENPAASQTFQTHKNPPSWVFNINLCGFISDYDSYMCSLLKIKTTESKKYRHPQSNPNSQNIIAVNCCLDIVTGDHYNCPQFIGDETENSKELTTGSQEVSQSWNSNPGLSETPELCMAHQATLLCAHTLLPVPPPTSHVITTRHQRVSTTGFTNRSCQVMWM